MPAFPDQAGAGSEESTLEFSVLRQRVDFDVDFVRRSLKGNTEIEVQPLVQGLKHIRLNCRQCKPLAIQAGGITAKWTYTDPYRRIRMPAQSNIHQYEHVQSRLKKSLRPEPEAELEITLPQRLKIHEIRADPSAANAAAQLRAQPVIGSEPAVALPTSSHHGPEFQSFKLFIEFEVELLTDGVHWIGHAEGDRRFPYMYTKVDPFPGNLSSIFPCVDDGTTRCSWQIAIRCPRTLGDAFKKAENCERLTNGHAEVSVDAHKNHSGAGDHARESNYVIDLSEQEAASDLSIICVGQQVDDLTDPHDETRHTVVFDLEQATCARHVGFAIGPFEQVDLSSLRDSEEEDRLGRNAIKVTGYCAPGKREHVLNTCLPLSSAIDHMAVKYGSFPFGSYQIIFVDDFPDDSVPAAGITFCSSSLLFPCTVIEPLDRNTRILVRGLANQWSGVNLIASQPSDAWVIAGIAGFMTDLYMRDLAGNNEYRWRQRAAADRVYELDVDRPSLHTLGELLHLDASIREFVDLKSALILFMLDRRMMKTTGATGVQRIIYKIFLIAKTGALLNGEVSTVDFTRTCERLTHNKLESFFRQWVYLSGCPIFLVQQKYNKKKLVVELTIIQKQLERATKPKLEPSNFMREIKEHVQELWAPEANGLFVGPMTIRIHEADGTPYEHIVEIKEAVTRLEVPYNTKYRRLKRSKRHKERQAAEEANQEGGEDPLLYCLGDILDTDQEKQDWRLHEWTEKEEDAMGQESFEWIRMDADFEWLGKIHLQMPLYMYVSQLQQDRDVVAQYESLKYIMGSTPHKVGLSILVRTLMDTRYFHGVREMAAEGLAIGAKGDVEMRDLAKFHLLKAFRALFCISDTNMPKSNDFSDRRQFILQRAIPRAMTKLRDQDDKVPLDVRQFFVDLLKFNDNSTNKYSEGDPDSLTILDHHYVASLMHCLTSSLVASHRESQPTYSFSFGDEEEAIEPEDTQDSDFEKVALAQIERQSRIDEWDASYQNIYSVTALDCLQRMTKVGILKDRTREVLSYTWRGNADNVRISAFRCLAEIGATRQMSVLKYLLQEFATASSPMVRERLLEVFGEALGHLALPDPEPRQPAAQQMPDAGLVVEQEDVTLEPKRLDSIRDIGPEGALVALKAALEGQEEFKTALWMAITTPGLSLDEVSALCNIAALLYEPVYSLVVTLDLPRMWRCRNEGHGKVVFTPREPYRIRPRKPLGKADWQNLQSLGLKYTGPLSEETKKAQKQAAQFKTLKLKISQTVVVRGRRRVQRQGTKRRYEEQDQDQGGWNV